MALVSSIQPMTAGPKGLAQLQVSQNNGKNLLSYIRASSMDAVGLLLRVSAATTRLLGLSKRASLTSLPAELIQQIADDLPLESVVSLSLTCKKFRVMLMHQASAISQDRRATSKHVFWIWTDLWLKHFYTYFCDECNKLYYCRWPWWPSRENPWLAKCAHGGIENPALRGEAARQKKDGLFNQQRRYGHR